MIKKLHSLPLGFRIEIEKIMGVEKRSNEKKKLID